MAGRRTRAKYIRLLTGLLWLATACLLMASEYHGKVLLNGLAVPGGSVTATKGKTKMTAVTDDRGVYSFPDLPDGSWTVEVNMTGFSSLKQNVFVSAETAAGSWELTMLSVDQIISQ